MDIKSFLIYIFLEKSYLCKVALGDMWYVHYQYNTISIARNMLFPELQ
ncbi:hypothetical protein SPSYN_02642 [Sporotomaculum syntrophicum]|uniref:Uncharacterized protein n=1 Tax=Sporotomaculum syntrophicum TaxID=182264 RepID=A0A9D3AY02_9FIRM|nr:hypothetical protein SPSYN_02642 [Sporotomaculum syntrophicum]